MQPKFDDNASDERLTPNEEHLLVAAAKKIGRGIVMVCDPMAKVCVPVFQAHWEKKYRSRYPKHAAKLLLLDLGLWFLVGALIVIAIFLRTVLPAFPFPETVIVESRGHYAATSGEPVTVSFRFRNESSGDIADAEAVVPIPPQLVLLSSSPAAISDGNEARFLFGTVAPGESRDFSLTATAFAPTDAVIPIAAELHFWKEAAAQPTRAPVRAEIRIVDADLGLTIATTRPLIVGQRNEVRVSYVNKSTRNFDMLSVTLALPPGFAAASSQPTSWTIANVAPGAGGTFAVAVISTGIRGGAPVFIAKAETEAGGAKRVVQTARCNPPQEATGFALTAEIANAATVAHPSDLVDVVVRYANRGSRTLRLVRMHAQFDERYVVESAAGDILPIDTLAPGESGEWHSQWHIVSPITEAILNGDATPVFSMTASADYRIDDGEEILAETEPVTIPLTTELGIRGLARYRVAGEQVGSGPIPPAVGERTAYRVFLSAKNGAGAAADVIMTATLPETVEWTGKSSVTGGEAIDYLPSTRTVRWRIGAMPRFTEDGAYIASFELAITPTENQHGNFADLLRDVKIAGVDSATGAKIQSALAAVETEHAVR